MTFLRSFVRRRSASLPAVVVFPEPCRPAIKMTAGGLTATFSGAASPPSTSTRTSLTILITCWSGRTAFRTSTPTACSRTRDIKVLTTGRATSASSRASRTSRNAASTSASRSAPRLPSPLKTSWSLSFRLSNILCLARCHCCVYTHHIKPAGTHLWHPCSKPSRTDGTR